jgi:DNA-binding LacI/PurR family transcriptional regulator
MSRENRMVKWFAVMNLTSCRQTGIVQIEDAIMLRDRILPVVPDQSVDSPLYIQIASRLRELIARSGRESIRLPSERDLSRELAVNRATVRGAIALLEREGLIVRRPRSGIFSRGTDGSHSRNRGRTVALVGVFDRSFPMTGDVVFACERLLRKHRFTVHTFPSRHFSAEEQLHEERSVMKTVLEEDMAGVLVWLSGGVINIDLLQQIQARGIPIVMAYHTIPNFSCDSAISDGEKGAYQATTHLITLGHTRIGLIAPLRRISTVIDRTRGYVRALEEADLPITLEYLAAQPIESPAAGYIAMAQLLQHPNRPTAVFCINDMTALWAWKAVLDHGLRVPEDIAIVSYGNDTMASPLVQTCLTTANLPFTEIGVAAVELLIERIHNPDIGPPRQVVLPTSLVVRATCGAGTSSLMEAAPALLTQMLLNLPRPEPLLQWIAESS